MKYINNILTTLVLGSTLALACSSKNLDLDYYPREKPLIAGVDGLFSANLHNVGSKLEQECNTPVVIEPVGFWYANMPEIRQAYIQRRKICFIGFSMGSEQMKRTAKQCKAEGIPIDLVIVIDPTYTNLSELDMPDNVKRIRPYFSTNKADLMGWARGDPKKFKSARKVKAQIEEPVFLKGTHLSCVNWNNLNEDLISEVSRYTK